MPSPAVTSPPGLLIYNEISFLGSSASKNNNWAVTNEAILSFIWPVKKIILSFNNLDY